MKIAAIMGYPHHARIKGVFPPEAEFWKGIHPESLTQNFIDLTPADREIMGPDSDPLPFSRLAIEVRKAGGTNSIFHVCTSKYHLENTLEFGAVQALNVSRNRAAYIATTIASILGLADDDALLGHNRFECDQIPDIYQRERHYVSSESVDKFAKILGDGSLPISDDVFAAFRDEVLCKPGCLCCDWNEFVTQHRAHLPPM